jgi:hypothetical protein
MDVDAIEQRPGNVGRSAGAVAFARRIAKKIRRGNPVGAERKLNDTSR